MNKRKKLTAEQIVEKITQYAMDVTEWEGQWTASTWDASSDECATLERAVYECARKVENRISQEERKEREEYERLKAKYGDNR